MKFTAFFLTAFLFVNSGCTASNEGDPEIIKGQTHHLKMEILAEGLINPWSLAFLPDGRILLTERPGNLRIYADGILGAPLAGLPPVWVNGQGGLLEVALHPEFEENGWIYLAYASSPDGQQGNTAIGRARLDGDKLIDFEQIFQGKPLTTLSYHFGCRIVFDEQNRLYFSIGDRGEMQNAQKLNSHNGKVMRIHDDGRIPTDNPFVGRQDALPEIYNYGHRNIQGMAVHPVTAEIWTHEHGPKGGDEINIEQAGANYGWPLVSFGINYDGTIITNDTAAPGITNPIHYWVPSIAPCGMSFVTSARYPHWNNNLLVTALAGQHIQRLVFEGNQVVETEKLFQAYARFRDVRQGPDGFLYVLTEGPGQLIKLLPEE
ncbi:MAG: PQQ-dependent sugar dehydrogenase [Bacteroidetes bacterium]|jgi:glucose/arabinose dehydrogenase|nr:PQQ-dependent sugar dehydrogenase [Bacteroidota bacterium]